MPDVTYLLNGRVGSHTQASSTIMTVIHHFSESEIAKLKKPISLSNGQRKALWEEVSSDSKGENGSEVVRLLKSTAMVPKLLN